MLDLQNFQSMLFGQASGDAWKTRDQPMKVKSSYTVDAVLNATEA